jgi:hypothetical protein
MSSTLSAEAVPTTHDRATGGRFAVGNPGGPGNPFAQQMAALRAALVNGVTERDIRDILDIALAHLPRRLVRRCRWKTVVAAALRCGAGFGGFRQRDEPRAEGGLPLTNVGDDRMDVKTEHSGQFLASAMNFRDDRVFPHRTILP